MEVTLEPIWSWPAVMLTAVGLVAFVVWTYRIQAATLSPSRRRLLLSLKLAAVAILVFALFRPAIQYSETDKNTVQLLVGLDVSRSMNTADAPGNLSRLQAATQDLAQQSELWKTLGEKVTVRQFEFDRDLRPKRPEITSGDGDQTAIGNTLESFLREARQERTLGILLLTDGAQRAVPPYDIDPLQAARQLAAEQAPVYPVGYGATALNSTTADLGLADLLIDPVVFEKKLVPLKVQLRASGAANKTAKVRVYVEDRGSQTIGQSGELQPAVTVQGAKVSEELKLTANDEVQTFDLSFVPQRAGEIKVAVEVTPLDGEILTRNNRIETIITVRQGGLRVAYFDVIGLEQRGLRMVNGSDKIQLDFYDVRSGRYLKQTRIDPAIFDKGAYDVYIIGDVSSTVFGPVLLAKLTERVADGAGLLMIGGLLNWNAQAPGAASLADYLPVTFPPSAAGGIDRSRLLTGPQPMRPTETGLKRYVMQLAATDKNRAKWEALAPLYGATKLTPKPGLVEIWAQTQDGSPLLCAAEVGRSRVAVFGGYTTYLWVQHGQAADHQRFWRQMILWLARKEADTNQAIWAKVEPRNFLPGGTVPIEFGAREDNGQPITDAAFTVEVTQPDGTKRTAAVQKSGEQMFAAFPETMQAGDYWVKVSASRNGNLIGLDAYTRFIVDPRDLELDQPNADYETLQKIAELTGGQLLRSEDLAGWLGRLSELKLEDLTRVTILPLWDNVWLMLLFVVVMTTEWACRKRWGLA
ncbi:hypothetical protein GC163_09485 [bacterium]|nr:hypothetical protein [bacterium]